MKHLTKAQQEIIKHNYNSAIQHLQKAEECFKQIGKMDQRDFDSDHFKFQVGQILSCDNGEAGLIPFVKNHKS